METKYTKTMKLFSIPAILFAVFFAFGNEAKAAADYYVATNGNDNNPGTEAQPWATFARAQDTSKSAYLQPGDTLMIKDGTYIQSLNVTLSGIQGNPITIKAENDGGAIIDGGGARNPFLIQTKHDITVEGLVVKNSVASVVVVESSDRVTLKRVSAYSAASGNNMVFSIQDTTYLLLEDCFASNSYGRVLYNIYGADYTTMRRCSGKWVSHSGGGGPNLFIQIYGSNDSVIENCIGTKATSASADGIHLWVATYNESGNRNKFYGNVVYGFESWGLLVASEKAISNNEFYDNVSINNPYGFGQEADSNITVNHLTVINASSGQAYLTAKYIDGLTINGSLKNSVLMDSLTGIYIQNDPYVNLTQDWNNVYNNVTTYSGKAAESAHNIHVNPNYETATFGKGAYLIVPSALKGQGENGADIGAEVIYRYVDGTITGDPLWPWPMEDRIKAETGISVTWETNGGLWKTLDGVYFPSGDTVPPAAPSGLQVQ